MSDFPELRLFDEVQDLATSSDFFAFTRDQFNRAWQDGETSSYSEDVYSMAGLWQTPQRATAHAPEGRAVGPCGGERSLWDPMLCDTVPSDGNGAEADLFHAVQQHWVDNRMMLQVPEVTTCDEEMEEEDLGDDDYTHLALATTASADPSEDEEDDDFNNDIISPVYNAQCNVADGSSKLTTGCTDLSLSVETCMEGSNRLSLKKAVRGGHRTAGGGGLVAPPSPRSLISRGCYPRKQQQQARRRRGGRRNAAKQMAAKRKLYEMPQFRDAHREKCRQNAINSKINRERRKNMLSEAEVAIAALKTINWRLVQEAVAGRQMLLAARREIQLLKKQLALDY